MAHHQSKNDQLLSVAAISRGEILERLNDSSLAMLNVLPRETFEAARIPGSINLPVAQIRERARDALPDVKQEIAVYCWSET